MKTFQENAMISIVVLLFCSYSEVKASAPNIVFILADDLGWDDVGFHGSEIKTPNIDRLAKKGVILNNYYVQPLCTPTRGAILTGRYPIHTGLQHYVIAGSEPYGLPLKEKTLAQHLKSLGYKTHVVGKWHLGFFKKEYLPTSRGFDSHVGYYLGKEDYFDHYSDDGGFFGYDFHRNGNVLWNQTNVYSTEFFTSQAESIIRNHDRSKPLFLYMAHQAAHSGNQYDPIQAPQKYIDRFPYIKNFNRRKFAGVVSALDDSVGQLYKALEDSGLAKNTILVFSTDNGGPTNGYDRNAACNWPLRGCKRTIWQGGVRGVGFVHSPLLKYHGYINNNLMHVVDWMPTLLSAATMNATDKNRKNTAGVTAKLDGINQWETISQKVETSRKEVLINIDPISNVEGIVVGDFKLVKGEKSYGKYDGWYPPPSSNSEEGNDSLQIEKPRKSKVGKGDKVRGRYEYNRGFSILDSNDENDLENGVNKFNMYQTGVGKRYDLQKNESCDLDRLIAWMNKRYENITGHHVSKFKSDENSLGVELVLRRTEKDDNVRVKCGPKPLNASKNCNAKKKACLFHLTSDPCEYNNLARLFPDIVEKMQTRLDYYRSSMIPPGNKPVDPRGNPQLHGGVWQPWL